MKYIFSYCLLFFMLAGRSQEIEFSHLSIEDGLSQNSVLSTTQDGNGFLWFGTRNGLNKYDSYRFSVYRNSPAKKGSISDNYVTALLCDSRNTIWVGTHNGLNRYDAGNDSFSRISLATETSSDEVNKFINCIYEDRKGRIWIGTDFTVKILTRGGSGIKVSSVPLFKKKLIVRCIYQDRESIFWVGTSNGVIRLREGRNGFILLDTLQNKKTDKGSLSSNQVTSIVEDNEKNIWIGTSAGGLNLYSRLSGSFTHFGHNNSDGSSLVNNNIRKLLFDTKNNLWVGTQDGLSILDARTGKFRNYRNDPWNKTSLSQNSIHSLFKDKTGTIWIGTFFGGVNSFFSYKTPFKIFNNRSVQNRLNNNVISSIIEDDHSNLWVGTEGGGVNYLDRATGRSAYYIHNPEDPSSLGSNLVKTIYKDKENNIWIGTHGGGLNLLNRDRYTFTRFMYQNNETLGSEITCLLEDSRGIFWVGTETAGVRMFKKNGTDINPINFIPVNRITKNAAIFSILEATDKKIWLGTARGLYIIGKDRIAVPQQAPNFSAVKANCIFEDARGSIWVGVNNNGLLKYNKQGKFLQSYSEVNGLSNNNVLGILQDDKNTLWISTANGLCRFNSANNTFNSYTEADGLEGNIFNHNSYYKSKSGEMFFGGYNGFVSFFPKDIEINSTTPPVYITALKFNDNKSVQPEEAKKLRAETAKKEVRLRYDQNLFTIDFAALNYIKASKNTYKYFLKGYDKEWNTTGNPSVVYSNVPPGSYQFIVKGSNNDNIWSNPTTLNITVNPPFWKTWWAYTMYVLLVAGLIFLIIRYFFLRELYKKNQELTKLKLNFFTNISHEIRTHLSLIIGPVDRLITDRMHAPEDKQQLITIKNNSESLLQLVNELMDFRKAETGHLPLRILLINIVPFIESVYSSFHSLSASRNIQMDFISTSDDIEMYFDPEQLKKVFYNLITNAFKFTPDGSNISVNIEEKTSYADISVINKGKGISKENIGKLFDNYFQEDDYGRTNTGYGIGLALSKSIVELHGGDLTVTSESETNYTCFTVRLLKGRVHFSDDQIIIEEGIKAAEQIDPGVVMAYNESQTVNRPSDTQHTLLIVEDNRSIRALITEALQSRYRIIESENGIEGWQAAADQIPDLIISDVMMPEMDGLELCRRLKTDERTSHIPVILLTARNAVASQISGLQTGADIYLTKPFSLEILSLHIFNLLKAREALWKQFDRQIKPDLIPGKEREDALHLSIHPLDEAFINKMIQMVEEKLDDPEFGIAMLSKMAAMSQPVLFKKIKAITGLSANEFVKSLRLKKAAELLRENKYTVYEVSYIVGYDSSKYFSREFKKYYHKTPSEYAAHKTSS